MEVPEIDRVAWYPPEQARRRIIPAQAELIDRLEAALAARAAGTTQPAGAHGARPSGTAEAEPPR